MNVQDSLHFIKNCILKHFLFSATKQSYNWIESGSTFKSMRV